MARKNSARKVREKDTDFTKTSADGSIREMLVTIKLIEKGYKVSRPVVNTRYDLIAEKDSKFIRIQVKNLKHDIRKNPERLDSIDIWKIRAYSSPRKVKTTYNKSDADVIFAINKEKNDFAIIPIEIIPSSGIVKISQESERKTFLNSFKALDEFQ